MFRLNPVDVGTFMHNVLDAFSRLVAAKGISWRALEKEWCGSQVSDIIDVMLEKTSGTIFNSSKRYVYLSAMIVAGRLHGRHTFALPLPRLLQLLRQRRQPAGPQSTLCCCRGGESPELRPYALPVDVRAPGGYILAHRQHQPCSSRARRCCLGHLVWQAR